MKSMKTLFRGAIPLSVAFLLGSALAGWAYDGQSNSGNGVRVDVKPVQLSTGEPAEFAVRLNTHSGDLGQDLKQVAELRDDQGNSYTPVRWEGSPPGGHHRSGTLTFPPLQQSAKAVTLIIRDVRAPERSFGWQLN